MGFFARIMSLLFEPEPVAPKGKSTGWEIFTLKQQGATVGIALFLMQKPSLPAGRSFPNALRMEWKYAAHGLPTQAQTEAFYAFERIFDELTEGNDNSVRVRVRSAFGKRDWLFYVESEERFMARFNALMAQHPPAPVTFACSADPEWSEWRTSLEELTASGR